MLDYLILFYNYFKLFLGISLFSYIYKICFDSCNEKVTIKTKHNKTKHTIKSRIGLSIIYLFLIVLLYYTLTIRVVLTIFCSLALGIIFALDKFDRQVLEIFNCYDKVKFVRYIWKVFYSVISICFVFFTPVHNSISESVNQIYNDVSNKTKSKFNEHMFGDVMGKGLELGSGIKRALDEMSSQSKRTEVKTPVIRDEKSSTSNMSDYIVQDKSKTKNKSSNSSNEMLIGGNQKVILEETETDIKKEESSYTEQSDQAEQSEQVEQTTALSMEKITHDKTVESESSVEDMTIENSNIEPQQESEKIFEILKKMNEVFSQEANDQSDLPSSVEPSTEMDNSSTVESVLA